MARVRGKLGRGCLVFLPFLLVRLHYNTIHSRRVTWARPDPRYKAWHCPHIRPSCELRAQWRCPVGTRGASQRAHTPGCWPQAQSCPSCQASSGRGWHLSWAIMAPLSSGLLVRVGRGFLEPARLQGSPFPVYEQHCPPRLWFLGSLLVLGARPCPGGPRPAAQQGALSLGAVLLWSILPWGQACGLSHSPPARRLTRPSQWTWG